MKGSRHADEHEIKLNALFDALMNCALLRRRVTDMTIFGVCRQEMAGIAGAIDYAFDQMIKQNKQQQKVVNVALLHDKIRQLEECFQQVLQVTAREPLVFLLFIQGIKGFCGELESYR